MNQPDPDQARGAALRGVDNRKGGSRHVTMQPAQIVLDDAPAIACVIRDVSATGARLGVARRHALPLQFVLSVPESGLSRHVERVWRRGDFTGVRLLPVEAKDAARG